MISSIGISLRVPEILELLGVYTQNGWDMDFCKITKNLDL
jgi:hypothetical protein